MAVNEKLESAESRNRMRFVGAIVRFIRKKPLGGIGAGIVLLLLICGIFANFIAPYGMTEMDLMNTLAPPSLSHLMGTNSLGQDVLSRVIYGARISVVVGLSATSLCLIVACILGVPSGFLGGKVDLVAQRFVDAWMSLPALLILITVMSLVGRGLLQIIFVLGIDFGIGTSRIVRSNVMAIKDEVYVTAAKSIGSPTLRIIIRHIFPNIIAILIITFSTMIGAVILTESSLSFLGFGLPPDVASWGGMISGEGSLYMERAPWVAFWPGVALSLVVYGTNMFGDALRDVLDPRLRGGSGGMGSRGMKAAHKALLKKLRQKKVPGIE